MQIINLNKLIYLLIYFTVVTNFIKIYYYFSVEMATLTREDGVTKTRILPANEVEALIAEHERLEAVAEAAKKEKQKL